MATLLLVAALLVQADTALPPRDGRLLYLVSATTATRSEPDSRARHVSKLKAFDIVSGREAAAGWLQIDLTTGAADAQGQWIPIEPDNVVTGTMEALKYRVGKGQQTRWPERVRLDVARGRIRHGFSAEQVRLALGDPRSKALRHESTGMAEEWTYDTLCVVLSRRGVIAIEAIPLRR